MRSQKPYTKAFERGSWMSASILPELSSRYCRTKHGYISLRTFITKTMETKARTASPLRYQHPKWCRSTRYTSKLWMSSPNKRSCPPCCVRVGLEPASGLWSRIRYHPYMPCLAGIPVRRLDMYAVNDSFEGTFLHRERV